MMFENRQFIGFEDIVGIQYECLTCHAKLILPTGDIQRAPLKCSNCNEDWFGGQMQGSERWVQEFTAIVKELSTRYRILKDIIKVQMTLEVKSEELDDGEDDEK